MADFLSPEWIEGLQRAASQSDDLRRATADVRLIVQQRVGDVAYFVDLDHGTVAVRPGEADRADVTFVQDRETAEAIQAGELSAQAAFMIGKLRVTGEVALLMRHQAAFEALERALS